MTILKSETSRYALLLIILFCIATVAVNETIAYFEPRLPLAEFRILAAKVWALSLGFMLIAGAFGLLGIKIAAETEGTRRVGKVVDAMDYIRDGVLLLDRKGHVTGSNPEARQMANTTLDARTHLRTAFPCLSAQDTEFLLDQDEPHEIERPLGNSAFARTLRFRSHPSGTLSLVLISDVTATRRQRLRRRHAARLQLIGQIAEGVANDFNELLCAIAGNATVLPRLTPGSEDADEAIASIERNAEKGVALAGHLRALAEAGTPRDVSDMMPESVRAAADMLRDNLTDDWQIDCNISEAATSVPLGRDQIEQLVLNLGLLVADAMEHPGTITVSLLSPDDGTMQANEELACLLLIGGEDGDPHPTGRATTVNHAERARGVILSVIRSMLEEAGSKLECLTTPRGMPLYRISLAAGQVVADHHSNTRVPEELCAYISHWSILVAKHKRSYTGLDERLREIGANVIQVDDIMTALGRVDSSDNLDAMILDERLLVPESKALLRAILKLRPATALVVLAEVDQPETGDLAGDVVLVPAHASSDRILMALMDARRMAVRRKNSEAV